MADRKTRPRLGGVHEIAELLGVTRQAAGRALNKPDAPVPLAELRMGPVYDLDTIEAWDATRKKTTGPAKGTHRSA